MYAVDMLLRTAALLLFCCGWSLVDRCVVALLFVHDYLARTHHTTTIHTNNNDGLVQPGTHSCMAYNGANLHCCGPILHVQIVVGLLQKGVLPSLSAM